MLEWMEMNKINYSMVLLWNNGQTFADLVLFYN